MAGVPRLTRRDWLRFSGAGVVGWSLSGWLDLLAQDAARHPERRRSCILLWMAGGPSQMDTFDLKPGHANGGPFQAIATKAPGLRICEHLPQLAAWGHRMAVVRSMSTREGDHGRATFLVRTGYLPQGPVQYPTLGSLLSKELGREETSLPNAVSIAPTPSVSPGAFGPGFLGPQYAPLVVGESSVPGPAEGAEGNVSQALRVKDLQLPAGVDAAHATSRTDLLREMDQSFGTRHPGLSPQSHRMAYERAVRLMRTEAASAFNLDEEPPALRDKYGRSLFGQGCLLARRLVERGVPFVEVTLAGVSGGSLGWDTHLDNFNSVQKLCGVLDPAWATLMEDLKGRGLLDSTLVVWAGEFGRTPKINANKGRDHYPSAWTTVLAGGGINGGQAVGRTSKDGTTVEDRPVSVPDLLSTVCLALGIDPTKPNVSNVGRPIRIVDGSAKPMREILA